MQKNVVTQPIIMVVDDDWMNREVLEAYLQSDGYKVVLAHDGATALTMTEEVIPDLIMLDVNMPGMSGFEVCVRFKNDDRTQYTPVIMVTALMSDEDKIRAIEAGADDFLTKPFNSLLMRTRVRSLLRIKQLHDELEDRNDLLRLVLNRYVNEDVVDEILVDPEHALQLGGDTRFVTVFFADIRGFTSFAEARAAGEVLHILNTIFNQITDVIFEYHGTLDKYIGDELMAFFGAPIAQGDDVFNAVQAAIAMQDVFLRVRDSMDFDGLDHIGLGIGLHCGEVAIGNVGSERVMSYSVIGDVVNTARRIQQEAMHADILISEAVHQRISDRIMAHSLPPRSVSGKSQPIALYRVEGIR